MNQAGALVHVYADGSIRLNHGGTEMGQGLFIKVAQIVAETFGVPLSRVRITATSTAEVPNTSPTAASTGTDLNGWAAQIAATAIRARMIAAAAEHWSVDPATSPWPMTRPAPATTASASASLPASATRSASPSPPPATTRPPA